MVVKIIKNHIYELLIILVCLFHASLFMMNTYPINSGWGYYYSELLLQGKVPYRDFYYFVPPLDLLKELLFWVLSFKNVYILQWFEFAERAILWLLTYRLLTNFFEKKKAFWAVAFSVIIASGDMYDLYNGYNQTIGLLEVLLILFVVKFAQSEQFKEKIRWMIFSGFILGIMLLSKQPIFLANSLCYFIGLSVMCIKQKDRKYGWYCLSVIGGVLIPVTVLFGYLSVNHAVMPFIDQVFLNVDGKGNLFTIIVYSAFRRLIEKPVYTTILRLVRYLLILLIVCFFTGPSPKSNQPIRLSLYNAVRKFFNYKSNGRRSRIVWILFIGCVAIYFLGNVSVFIYANTLKFSFGYAIFHDWRFICFSLVAVLFLILAALFLYREGESSTKGFVFLSIGIAVLFIGVTFQGTIRTWFYSESGLFPKILSIIVPCLTILDLICIVYWAYHKKTDLFYYGIGAYSLFYASSMGNINASPASHSCRVVMPLMICVLLSIPFSHKLMKIVCQAGMFAVCTIFSLSCLAQKCECSYSWWGSTEKTIEEKIYEIDIPTLKGIRESKENAEMYKTITDLIVNNTDSDDSVWGYPYITIFNISADRLTLKTFVPVLFYDVTSDKYIEKELEMLKENLPEIILWKDIPGVLKTHEKEFRDGKPLKHRDIEEYLQKIIPEKYQLLGYNNGVEVYRLKEEGKTFATDDADAIVEATVEYDDRFHAKSFVPYELKLSNPLSFDAKAVITVTFKELSPESDVSLITSHGIYDAEKCDDCSLAFHITMQPEDEQYELCLKDSGMNAEEAEQMIQSVSVVCE